MNPPATLDAPQFALEGELERLLGHPVQVVALNAASPALVHRVLRDGLLVLDLVRDVVENRLGDLLEFVAVIRRKL